MNFKKIYQIYDGWQSGSIYLDSPDIDHYYKIKYEVSGEDAYWKNWPDQIRNGCLSTIIYLHMPDIW